MIIELVMNIVTALFRDRIQSNITSDFHGEDYIQEELDNDENQLQNFSGSMRMMDQYRLLMLTAYSNEDSFVTKLLKSMIAGYATNKWKSGFVQEIYTERVENDFFTKFLILKLYDVYDTLYPIDDYRFHWIMYLTEKSLKNSSESLFNFKFSRTQIGPYSHELANEFHELKYYGLMDEVEMHQFNLSHTGLKKLTSKSSEFNRLISGNDGETEFQSKEICCIYIESFEKYIYAQNDHEVKDEIKKGYLSDKGIKVKNLILSSKGRGLVDQHIGKLQRYSLLIDTYIEILKGVVADDRISTLYKNNLELVDCFQDENDMIID